ncbi:MAG TPA: hypothetical protein PKM57_04500 [Kiritimatiellia bacterium]|nr:hypothetical protein [Kiritimatiellia bacterium]HPS06108.1 hypothetical protein [Kiritimatiellia bacterium]
MHIKYHQAVVRWGVVTFFGTWLSSACFAAPQPQWIGASAPSPDRETVFVRDFELSQVPVKALLRLNAHDRYRLAVNGRTVGVGDTPWNGETYDVTGLLKQGPNTVAVTADADFPNPANCFIWLRRTLPAPAPFSRLSFKTRGARGDEWLYVEAVDDKGTSSGFYCLEKKRPDLMLGHSGKEADHVIELAQEPTLDYQGRKIGGASCDFSRIVSVGIRMDRKNAHVNPAGQVEFAAVKLHGPRDADLGDLAGWRLEPGTGEARRSRLERAADGFFVLRYDFTPAPDPKVAVDLRAWGPTGEWARVMSGTGWRANGAPASVVKMKRESFAWSPLEIAGPDEAARPPLAAALRLDFGDQHGVEDQPQTVCVKVWAAEALPDAQVQIRAENWAGKEVMREKAAVAWTGAVGYAELRTPALARGLYRFDAALPGVTDQRRHTALAVLAAGETKISSIFDTLTPVAKKGGPLHGVDTSWIETPANLFGFRDLGVNFLQIHLSPSQLDNGEFVDLLAFCKATGLRFALNNETANWVTNSPTSSGRNRFDVSGGCHRWDLEPAALDAAAATGLFEGVVYDEGEHMQLCRNRIAFPRESDGKPYLVETTGMTLPEAREAFIGAARQVSDYHREHKTRMIVESVFPALWHPLAQAGVTLCPKLLKEDVYPVVLALSLGAAKQYDAELWYTPDFWSMGRFPGHSVAKYEAALRLAHAAGVDNVYTEHFMGICRVRGSTYEVTEYGAALQTFLREYLPAHPRKYTYRDYEPEVAVIRFPDSDWGQDSCYYWKCLYGALNLAPTPETAEWMQVFSLLTGGKSDPRAVNANSRVYPPYEQPLMYAAPPTAVYDHLAGPGLLRGVNTIFLCGITVSAPTLAAVQARVKQGAVCFAPARLCPGDVRKQAGTLPARIAEGKGAWVVLAGFRPEDLGPYEPLLPPVGDALRVKFKGRTVTVGE